MMDIDNPSNLERQKASYVQLRAAIEMPKTLVRARKNRNAFFS